MVDSSAVSDGRPHEECDECGFAGGDWTVERGRDAFDQMGTRWRELLGAFAGDAVRQRPEPTVWSPLEYAAHTREILRFWHDGVITMLDGGALSITRRRRAAAARPAGGVSTSDASVVSAGRPLAGTMGA